MDHLSFILWIPVFTCLPQAGGNEILDHLCFSMSLNYFKQLRNQPRKNSGNSSDLIK
jgi:hypothetical protein